MHLIVGGELVEKHDGAQGHQEGGGEGVADEDEIEGVVEGFDFAEPEELRDIEQLGRSEVRSIDDDVASSFQI